MQTTTLPHIYAYCAALDAKKAENIRLLNVASISSITDYLIIASGNSEPHLKALYTALEEVLKNQKAEIIGIQKDAQSGWMVVDAFDVMMHLFLPETRTFYNLDALWKDAEEIDWA